MTGRTPLIRNQMKKDEPLMRPTMPPARREGEGDDEVRHRISVPPAGGAPPAAPSRARRPVPGEDQAEMFKRLLTTVDAVTVVCRELPEFLEP